MFAAFKLFVKWLASSTEKLESLPKNIDDRGMGISVAERKAKTLTKDEITTLLEEANPRTQLYLLLAANCAMTQIDMAELHPDEVDWEKGIITRKRSKTADCQNVPEVSWPLWPLTLELLKKERGTDPDRVLLTREGRPLRTDIMDGDKFKKTNARAALRSAAW